MVRQIVAMKPAALLLPLLLLAGCASFPEARSEGSRTTTPENKRQDSASREDGAAGEAEGAAAEDLTVATYTPPPEPVAESHPRSIVEVSGPAVVSLYRQAAAERDAGRPEVAVAVLERALRLEPRNAFVWSALAEAHLDSGNLGQAESVAQRANSFARGNPWLEAPNWRVIAEARRQSGDRAGAESAEGRAQNAQMRQTRG